jgi:hypothetical protein
MDQVERVCVHQHPLPAAAHFCSQCGAPAAGATTSDSAFSGVPPQHSRAAPAPAYGPPLSYGPLPYAPQPPGVHAHSSNALSNTAFWLAIVAVLILPILFGPAAIICAGVALSRRESKAGLAMALAITGMLVGFMFGAMVYASL